MSMAEFRRMSVAEQVAAHLRRELEASGQRGIMPGVLQLEADLGVNRKTVQEALGQLETEGLLIPQGSGRRRKIIRKKAPPSLRIAILLGEPIDRRLDYVVEFQHKLSNANYGAVYAPKSMAELGMDLRRIQRMVRDTQADAWIVLAGSDNLLEWFVKCKIPTFALFGRRRDKRIAGAGPDKSPTYAEVTRRLAELGHRRIVLLARPRRRLPEPGSPEQAFLDELAAQRLPVSNYNLPDWEETPAGFHARLAELFRITPPTALILDEAPLFFGARQFLGHRRLRIPEDVSLVCTDHSPDFQWCQPLVSHIRWDSAPSVRRILKWAANVSHGKEDFRQIETQAEFCRGGTIGPVLSLTHAR